MTKRVLGFLSAVMLFFASAGYSLEIFYPADHSFVTKSNYLIIKGGENLDLDGFVIELND